MNAIRCTDIYNVSYIYIIVVLKAVGQQYAISKQACGVIYDSVVQHIDNGNELTVF